MTKHIPNKQRRLEWEVEELRRRMLRRNDAADALEKAEADLQTQERIVALMRGEEFGSSTFGTGDSIVWGPDGNPLIPVEPLVGQPGASERNTTLLPDNTPYGDVPVYVLPDNAPNDGDWKAYHEEQLRLAKQAEPLVEQARSQAFQEQREAKEADELAAEILDNAAQQVLAEDKPPTLESIVASLADKPEAMKVLRDFKPVPPLGCSPPLHRFSGAKSLAIGTPCFCGVRQWGVDPAKEGAKP